MRKGRSVARIASATRLVAGTFIRAAKHARSWSRPHTEAAFFKDVDTAAIATTRAGNVLGGGDWAPDRLVPDVVRACAAGEAVKIRYPHAVRPWQQVLEPLHGYLQLAESLVSRSDLRDAWNFGPSDDDMKPVLGSGR